MIRPPPISTLLPYTTLFRSLQHVPMPQTRVVRSYGLYQPTQTAALVLCRAALGQPLVVVPVRLAWQTVCAQRGRSEEHTSELQSRQYLVCRLLLVKKKAY